MYMCVYMYVNVMSADQYLCLVQICVGIIFYTRVFETDVFVRV
jgi:hypothetical protein